MQEWGAPSPRSPAGSRHRGSPPPECGGADRPLAVLCRPPHVDLCRHSFKTGEPLIPAGETGLRPGAEGATAPETLRPKDRAGAGTLESGDAGPASPTDGRNLRASGGKSLR